jgi:hypothetical protein
MEDGKLREGPQDQEDPGPLEEPGEKLIPEGKDAGKLRSRTAWNSRQKACPPPHPNQCSEGVVTGPHPEGMR